MKTFYWLCIGISFGLVTVNPVAGAALFIMATFGVIYS